MTCSPNNFWCPIWWWLIRWFTEWVILFRANRVRNKFSLDSRCLSIQFGDFNFYSERKKGSDIDWRKGNIEKKIMEKTGNDLTANQRPLSFFDNSRFLNLFLFFKDFPSRSGPFKTSRMVSPDSGCSDRMDRTIGPPIAVLFESKIELEWKSWAWR